MRPCSGHSHVHTDFLAIAADREPIIRPVLLDLDRAKPWSSKEERISNVIGQAQHHCGDLECFAAYHDREVFEQPQRLHCTSICHAEMEGATGPIQDAEVTASGLIDHVDSRLAVNDNSLHMLVIHVEGEDSEVKKNRCRPQPVVRVRNNSRSNGKEKQNTETENDIDFNVETQTGKKPRGVHKLRNRTL